MNQPTGTRSNRVLLAIAASLGISCEALAVEPLVQSQCAATPALEAACHGEGLTVTPSESGARLRCAFQRLEGEATREGLWLRSTVSDTLTDRFRVMAGSVGRLPFRESSGAAGIPESLASALPATGDVSVEGPAARFTRPGLIEEYSVSMDGVRQDFVVAERPEGTGELRVQLEVTGAQVEPAGHGAQLVLPNSGRKIAYSRLRVTDAKGRELPARMEVSGKSEIRNPKFEIGLAVVVNDADAVYPIRIDPTFSDANWISMGGLLGANGVVYAAVVDGLGNLYIGGYFTIVGDLVANGIAKWNGNSWSALGSGLNGGVRALAVLGSDVYAGGEFTTLGETSAPNIAKWNGSTWTALGSGLNVSVSALAVSGSEVYAGGEFTTAGGKAATNIAKWNGSSWSALGSGLNGTVSALAASGSDVYAGGEFTTAGETSATNIAKWNGSTWSALGSGLNGGVRALAVLGSDVYAGGFFTTAGGTAANHIAKWDGSSWSPLDEGMDGYAVYALAVSGSALYAGGDFSMAGGVDIGYGTAKWNGTNWSALRSGIRGYSAGERGTAGIGGCACNPPPPPPAVYALAVSGSDLYAGGDFTIAGGSKANYIAKWNGSTWSTLGSGIGGGDVSALAVSGSDVYAGGRFTTAGGSAANHIAKWNGSSWSPLGGGPFGSVVSALAVSGSDLYAACNLWGPDGQRANGIAKWNGSTWSALGSGMNGDVTALAVWGRDLYAGGGFTTAGGSPATNIAKWNGSTWSALGSGLHSAGLDSVLYALAVLGSDLYAGGRFTTAGGTPAKNIAKWNGSSWSALGSGLNGDVFALAVSGSDLYAGGGFTTAGGSPATNIAKWNGSTWSALGQGMRGLGITSVRALAVSGSDVYAGGYFLTVGGTPANSIAKWNGNTWSALGSGMDDVVTALAVSGSDLYAGGYFMTAGGKVSPNVARAYLEDGLPPIIVRHPFSREVLSGSTLELNAEVLGRSPFSYQWQHNGVALNDGDRISGATTNRLFITEVQAEDAGTYAVTVSNAHGSIDSLPAVISVVFKPPEIAVQPTDRSVPSGSSVSLSVVATGSLPMTYQWQRNGVDLIDDPRVSGARAATLTIGAVDSRDVGIYSVTVVNPFGEVSSLPVSLDTVFAPPWITAQPQRRAAALGSEVLLEVQVSGSQPLSFQWQLNGVDVVDGPRVSGARASTLQITGMNFSDLGSYSVIVSNAYGWLRSGSAELTTSTAVLFTARQETKIAVWWNDAGQGMVLQGATSLVNPQWQDVPGSQLTNRVTLPMTNNQFFRLFRPVPVLAGPMVNAGNGHVYYLLPESSWTEAEALAERLGGTLAIINDQSENNWVYSTFGMYAGVPRALWIGLTDAAEEGTWVWVTGQPVSYVNWATISGEPNNNGGAENYAYIFQPGEAAGRESLWNDNCEPCGRVYGVVEVGP